MTALTARPIRAILFDLDGTLVDSAGDLRHALNAVLESRASAASRWRRSRA